MNFKRMIMKRFGIIVGLLFSTIVAVAQTALVGGTTFDQKDGYTDWGWDFSTIKHLGPMGNEISSTINYMADASDFQSGRQAWVIVDNPRKLGTNENDDTSIYPDIDDAMYVASPFLLGSQKEFLTYTAKGLKPGTAYSVSVTYYVLHEPMVVQTIDHGGWVETVYPGLKPWDQIASLIIGVNGNRRNTDA